MRRRLLPLTLLLALGTALLAGCSTRRVLTIDTRPSGARIWVNGQLRSRPTPVEHEFTHYGYVTVRVEKTGYESVDKEIRIPAKIDGYPVIDLFIEMGLRERRFNEVIELKPLRLNPTEADLGAARRRAEAFRERTRREVEEAQPPERLVP